MNICVVGMGLIGGSVCKAVREYTTHRIYGVDTDLKTVQAALEDGVVDGIIEDGNYAEIDMTIVCLYPYITAEFLKENMSRFKKDSIVCDFCGIKSFLVQQMTDLAKKCEVRYVSAHPMSGRGGLCEQFKNVICREKLHYYSGSRNRCGCGKRGCFAGYPDGGYEDCANDTGRAR